MGVRGNYALFLLFWLYFPNYFFQTNDLWRYCTEEFLVKVDRINSRIERCPINAEWKEVQNAFCDFNSSGLIERNKQINLEAQALIPNIMGSITSYSARIGDYNFNNIISKIYRDSEKYFKNKETTFEEVVKNKMLIINKKGDTKYE